jgi:tetratricopeptide (TPR) repeat protein
MERNSKAAAKVGLTLVLLLLSLNSICLGQVPHNVESLALEQKWSQVRQGPAPDDFDSNPVYKLLSAYSSLATADYRGAAEYFSRLGSAADVSRLAEYASVLVRRHPKSGVAHMLKGDALARNGTYEEALATMDEAVRLEPRSALIYDVRGVIRALAGKTDAAVEDLDKAIQMAPDFADAYANRGLVRGGTGSFEEALMDLHQALDLAPDHVIARNARAVMFAAVGRLEEAKNDPRIAAQSNVGLLAVVANLSTLEWLDARVQFKGEVADQRGGVLRMEALSVYSGVNTEDNWKQHANIGVDVLRRKTGQDAIVVPFKANESLSYAQMRDKAYSEFMTAAREGKNIVPVIVPHLTLAGYLSPVGRADQIRDLEFGKTATLAIHAGFLKAQNDLTGRGQQVALAHSALSHSWGTVVQMEAIEHTHRQLGLHSFTGDLWYVAPRVGQERIAGLNRLGYDPSRIHVATIKGDAWAAPGFSAASIRLYQDFECILPHDHSPSIGGAYAKRRGCHRTCREFTGHDRLHCTSIPGAAAAV